jgi:hypothetical protein
MSDPVKNVEIEDVLSSIRRLVSNEARVAPRKLGTPLLDRLVLTQDQRVPDDDLAQERRTTLPRRPLASSVALQPKQDQPMQRSSTARGANGSAADQDAMRLTGAGELKQRAAAQVESKSLGQSGASKPSDVVSLSPMTQAPKDATAGSSSTGEERSLESKIAELEAMFAQGGRTWDPTTEADIPPVGKNGATAAVRAEVVPKQPTETRYDLAPSEGAAMDDSDLREMVSDIVRKELQGVLGEQSTRNVRKLVRREINRALLSQDFD